MRLSEMIYTEEELQQEIRAKESWRDLYREQLEKNKKLKEEIDRFKDNAMEDMRVQTKLEEENKKLKEELGKITIHSNMLESENKLFKEELKARLDRIKELEK